MAKKKVMRTKKKMAKKPMMHMEEEVHIEVPNAKKVRKKLPLSEKVEEKIETVMHEFKTGALHSGSKKGPKVKSRKQAVAIALSEAGKAKKKKSKKKK